MGVPSESVQDKSPHQVLKKGDVLPWRDQRLGGWRAELPLDWEKARSSRWFSQEWIFKEKGGEFVLG